ncbi:DeoR/GlpR family DNA-binding transcription regulator [Demequina zhanjiangensis]|uniref:DeoR/GlpR family DNA-binding transcription regulator n=1 Tax=Demequina zhanjiangensis TaxID=3051659 RepID=A0ABT8G1L4_9MICO|nr:DeoR/GlpR family DNA-binding transcription regulator [Demequina sp. SYSU T00b26]MDN4472609.1 DeoR/GlpR family DNA-binding transcription regulator [Demequina sp. SYSU T00b26]
MSAKRDMRLQKIVELLEERGKLENAALSQELGVAELTIRRDIEHLDAQGMIRRVYGGAVLASGRSFEPPFQMRLRTRVAQKQAIAKAAVDLVPRGANVAIDFGTKAYYVACEMRDRNLQALVAPTSLQVLEVLGQRSDIRVLVPGGELKHGELSFYGSRTELFFRRHRWDLAIVSVAGVSVDPEIISDYNEDDARLKNAMVESSDRVVLLVEEHHLGAVSFSPVASTEAVTTIITDAPRDNSVAQDLAERGIEMIHVTAEEEQS